MTTILKFGWDFSPGAVCYAVDAFKLVDVPVIDVLLVISIVITNCVEEFVSF